MKLLHICSYYVGNKLYENMVGNLATKNIDQTVYIPVRSKAHLGRNKLPESVTTVDYKYSNILNKFDRLFFKRKINKQKKDIEENVINKMLPEVIHAHTVFSDGGTAYLLNKKYGIKYILNVRNTDINYYYKYAIHLRPFTYKVLLNADSIVFISHAYKKRMHSLLPSRILEEVEKKCYVIPNGIENYWHENAISNNSVKMFSEVTLLFIGLINKNKNLKTIIYACKELNKRGIKVSLNVIGNGPLEVRVKKMCERLNIRECITFHGYISDRDTISAIMDESDIFVMPSFKETFGLVYVEAISRGLPIVYTQEQGIDGFFHDGEVGYAIEPESIEMLCNTITKIMGNYKQLSNQAVIKSKEFNWDYLTEKIRKLY